MPIFVFFVNADYSRDIMGFAFHSDSINSNHDTQMSQNRIAHHFLVYQEQNLNCPKSLQLKKKLKEDFEDVMEKMENLFNSCRFVNSQ